MRHCNFLTNKNNRLMIVICKKCNGSGNQFHFPVYSNAKCETCNGTGEMISFFFDIHTILDFPETNEITCSVSWFKGDVISYKNRIKGEHNFPVQLILNHHTCSKMSKDELNEYVLQYFDQETTTFDLPEILSIEQLQQLHFQNDKNNQR